MCHGRTELEHTVHAIWAEALGAPRIGIHQNFFSAGGTSLLAGMVALKLNEALGSDESATLLFNNPTIEAVAARMEGLPTGTVSQEPIPVAPFTDAQRATQGVPCSLNQEQMIAIEMSSTDTQYYTQPLAFELAGELNQPALEQALQIITQRHEALRTRFLTSTSEPRQVVLPAGECRMPMRVVQHPDANTVTGSFSGWTTEQVTPSILLHYPAAHPLALQDTCKESNGSSPVLKGLRTHLQVWHAKPQP